MHARLAVGFQLQYFLYFVDCVCKDIGYYIRMEWLTIAIIILRMQMMGH